NTVPSEIPVAKTTSVPHGIFFCTSDHVYILYLGNNINATDNIVSVVESNGCNIPSVAHNVNKLIDITINRHLQIDILLSVLSFILISLFLTFFFSFSSDKMNF